MACLKLHRRRQAAACFLTGSGPWQAGTNTHLPLLLKPWAPLRFLEHCKDIPDPKSLQLSPRSDSILLCKQSGQEEIYVRGLYICLLERLLRRLEQVS